MDVAFLVILAVLLAVLFGLFLLVRRTLVEFRRGTDGKN